MYEALPELGMTNSIFHAERARRDKFTRPLVEGRYTLERFEASGELTRVRRLQLGVRSWVEERRS